MLREKSKIKFDSMGVGDNNKLSITDRQTDILLTEIKVITDLLS